MVAGQSFFITDLAAYEFELESLSRILHLDRRLPDMVFRNSDWHFAFTEFDELLHSSVCTLIANESAYSGENYISILCIEPDFQCFSNDGYFGAARIHRDELFASFAKMTAATPVRPLEQIVPGSIDVEARFFAIYDYSKKWAIIADREMDVAIYGTQSASLAEKALNLEEPRMLKSIVPDNMYWTRDNKVKGVLLARNYHFSIG